LFSLFKDYGNSSKTPLQNLTATTQQLFTAYSHYYSNTALQILLLHSLSKSKQEIKHKTISLHNPITTIQHMTPQRQP